MRPLFSRARVSLRALHTLVIGIRKETPRNKFSMCATSKYLFIYYAAEKVICARTARRSPVHDICGRLHGRRHVPRFLVSLFHSVSASPSLAPPVSPPVSLPLPRVCVSVRRGSAPLPWGRRRTSSSHKNTNTEAPMHAPAHARQHARAPTHTQTNAHAHAHAREDMDAPARTRTHARKRK